MSTPADREPGGDLAEAELVIEFSGWTRRVPLWPQAVVLGRSSDCDVPLADPSISRHHCRISPSGDEGWTIEDLSSQAGTLVDGVAIAERVALAQGQVVVIGSTRVWLEAYGAPVLSGDRARDERNVRVLLRSIGELYASEDAGELLRTIVDRAIALAGGGRGAVLLAGPGGALEAAVARDSGGSDLPARQALTRSLPDRALRSRRAVVLTDAEAPSQAAPESVVAMEVRSVLCVPLPSSDGEPLGVLYVDGQRPAAAFGPTELAVLEALAVQGALALERARLLHARRERLESENAVLRARLGLGVPVGQSPPMLQALELVRRIAPSDATACLIGETGTGKEILARWLHNLSPRAPKPFVVVDCGALPETLIESELFGHEKGAYTGASTARPGRFREAAGGTVFLDEIGELPLALQTRLLRVLQERTVQPVGASRRVSVDVRVICATHRDLERLCAEGRFREDLYYRLGVLTVPVPPLRARGGDVLLLAQRFLERHGAPLRGYTREAQEALLQHTWPGNVRELENRVHRAVFLAQPPWITRGDLGLGPPEDRPAKLQGAAEADLPFAQLQAARAEATERFEEAYVSEALRRTGGNVSRAAALAGVSRVLFQRLMRRHGIDRTRFHSS